MTTITEHPGGCHCGNLRLTLCLTVPAAEIRVRACECSFCRGHATRTVSDPLGSAEIRAADWSLVEPYRFGTGTADFLICRRCGIYIGAICETGSGTRAVINTNCLDSRAQFVRAPAPTDHEGETASARMSRRAANWTPALIHR
jgi:hypothetical protein